MDPRDFVNQPGIMRGFHNTLFLFLWNHTWHHQFFLKWHKSHLWTNFLHERYWTIWWHYYFSKLSMMSFIYWKSESFMGSQIFSYGIHSLVFAFLKVRQKIKDRHHIKKTSNHQCVSEHLHLFLLLVSNNSFDQLIYKTSTSIEQT